MNGVEVFVPLSRHKVAVIDVEDWDVVRPYKWHAHVHRGGFCAARNSERTSEGKRKTIRLHRVLMGAPADQEVDHEDGNPLNDKRNNLRLCTPRQNSFNTQKRKNTLCKYKGVRWHKSANGWQAFIQQNNPKRFFHLGIFLTAEDAAQAYDTAAQQRFGEFAKLNFSNR